MMRLFFRSLNPANLIGSRRDNVRRWGCLLAAGLLSSGLVRAEEFGDLSVSASAMYSGNTFHGYSETRVLVQNHSTTKAHLVTLILPEQSWNQNLNQLRRIARTVVLAPGARESIPLLQPPLPVQGDGMIQVEVDRRKEGEVRAPNSNNHRAPYTGSSPGTTILTSRTLDFDAVEQALQANRGAFTAAMATGAPDASGGGYDVESWMPNQRLGSTTAWLELDYATPQTVSNVTVYCNPTPAFDGSLILIGTSGTNLTRLPFATAATDSSRSTNPNWLKTFSLPETTEPVKSVRLEFDRSTARNIAIDAVEINGSKERQWAANARASSDNRAVGARYGKAEGIVGLRAEAPITEWSENWLAYTPFDVVALHQKDLADMPAAVANALDNYLTAGGMVVVFGGRELPVTWTASSESRITGGSTHQIGFGRCWMLADSNPANIATNGIEFLKTAAREQSAYWQMLPADSSSANAQLPVVANLRVPTRGIVILMLLFILVVGPVNIFVLNRKQRRTWMLWTIPTLSFAATLLLFVYSLLREGITPDTRIVGLTLLDQTTHRAATVGAEAFYCPLTPSGGLNFEYDTEVTPQVPLAYGSGTAREMDWTESQHLERGWVSARVPAHFHIRKVETRRERIQLLNEAGQLKMVNGLGSPITELWLADANMNLYTAHSVAAGQKGSLLPVKLANTPEKLGAAALRHAIGYTAQTNDLPERAFKYLTPNTYIAVTESNPFLENALGTTNRPGHTKTSAVIYGVLESTASK